MNTNMKAFGIVIIASQLALADASYQSSFQFTGGALVDSLRSNPLSARMARPLLAPIVTLTMVHGNQKAVVTKESTEIIDLDKGTITRIDTARKTYSVMTFDQMLQAMKDLPQQMEQAQQQMQQAQEQMKQAQSQLPQTDLKVSFDVAVKDTGVAKVINGLNARERVLTMQARVTDPNAPRPRQSTPSPM